MSETLNRRKLRSSIKVDVIKNYQDDETNNESESEMEPLPSNPNGECFNTRKKNENEVLESAFKHLSPKWKNWLIRGIFGVLMISSFSFVVYLGNILSSQYSIHTIINLEWIIFFKDLWQLPYLSFSSSSNASMK